MNVPQFLGGFLVVFASFAIVQAQNNYTTPYSFTTFAGSAGNENNVADGVGSAAGFSGPVGLAVDGAGNLYVADNLAQIVRKISPGGEVSTLAGSRYTPGANDGVGGMARFHNPLGVAVDYLGNVYVADGGNNTIRKINSFGVVTTVAGTAGAIGNADGTGAAARFSVPSSIALDGTGTLYVCDKGNSTIRKISSEGVVTTLAGKSGQVGVVDGTGSAARFFYPSSIALDATGNLYVADQGSSTIRKVTTTGVVTTLAGNPNSNPSFVGSNDGVGIAARFDAPAGLALDSAGNVYVADSLNHLIRKITPAGVVTTVAGEPSLSGDNTADGTGKAAHFREPFGVAVSLTGNLFVSDLTDKTIRQGIQVLGMPPSITTQPLSGAVFAGDSVTFISGASGSPALNYQWQKNGIDIPGATSATLTLNNIQVSDAGSYGLVATNIGGSTTSRFARLVVLVPQANATTYKATAYPTGVTAGGNVGLDYVLTNTGTHNWGANHYLSIRDSHDTFVAFATLIGTNSRENKTVHLNFPAPTTPGTYTYTVQGLESGVEFFTTNTTFTLTVVAQAGNSITYNTTNFPVSATPGSNLIFNYNVTNTGTKPWGANHYLSVRNGAGAYSLFASLNGVAPGQSKTVNLSLTAPSTPGVYPYYVQALESGVEFFTAQANLTLTVLAPQPNAIVYTSTRSQDNVTPGATVNLRYTLSNAGTGTWGASHYASLRDQSGNFLAFVPLNGVAPLGTKVVNFSFTGPTTPGAYSYFVQALEDGVEFFDSQDLVTINVLATPIGNAATYNASTFPSTAARGAAVSFTANLTNRGTKTWGANHFLSLRDADNIFLGFLPLTGIAPGQSQTLTFNFTAPTAPGVYTYHVQGFESGVEFFNMSDNLVLIVP